MSDSPSKKGETVFETLKDVGLMILLLFAFGLLLVAILFFGLLALTWDLGTALGITYVLINPFLIFEEFGWGGIVVWLVIWLIIIVVELNWIAKSGK